MQIYHVEIEHFRGIEHCRGAFSGQIVCLIGPGDSTKSTILDAIEYVLSPDWFIPFDDSDFTDLDVEKEVKIDVAVGPVPEQLLPDAKYGLHLRGWSREEKVVHDEPQEGDVPVMTVRLRVDKDLTPEWLVAY